MVIYGDTQLTPPFIPLVYWDGGSSFNKTAAAAVHIIQQLPRNDKT